MSFFSWRPLLSIRLTLVRADTRDIANNNTIDNNTNSVNIERALKWFRANESQNDDKAEPSEKHDFPPRRRRKVTRNENPTSHHQIDRNPHKATGADLPHSESSETPESRNPRGVKGCRGPGPAHMGLQQTGLVARSLHRDFPGLFKTFGERTPDLH